MQNNHELPNWSILTSGEFESELLEENTSSLAFSARCASSTTFNVSACNSSSRLDAKLVQPRLPYSKRKTELKSLKEIADFSNDMFHALMRSKLKGITLRIPIIGEITDYQIKDATFYIKFQGRPLQHVLNFANNRKTVRLDGVFEPLGELVLGLDIKPKLAVLKLCMDNETFDTFLDILEDQNAQQPAYTR